MSCASLAEGKVDRTVGTMVVVVQTCTNCTSVTKWESQPYVRDTPAGNILLSTAILTSGASVRKVLRVLNQFRLACTTENTYFNHQRYYIQPAIVKVWQTEQTKLVRNQQRQKIIIGGDGRCDSMGHCVKFGSYSVMDLGANKVLDVQLVQSNEVKNSNAMELKGLKRSVKWMASKNVEIDTIVTDRHLQIAKWIRENLCENGVSHYFDVWHIAKGIKKKMVACGRQKDCGIIVDWIKAIVSQIYRIPSSNSSGDGELMAAKFKSTSRHIINVHEGHDEPYPVCAHGPLTGQRKQNGFSQVIFVCFSLQRKRWEGSGKEQRRKTTVWNTISSSKEWRPHCR
ncbi:uncharacterized protein [Asterias amurensis]|uniref:uncharacterized protein n=1 Tax=Asterias amurensis TaxID=7602 RepID=UPI003AB8AA32